MEFAEVGEFGVVVGVGCLVLAGVGGCDWLCCGCLFELLVNCLEGGDFCGLE